MDRQMQLNLWSAFLAVMLTLAAGWAGLKGTSFLLACIGIVGAIPMLLIEGVHGGTHVENMIGGVVFVLVNVMFYYFVLRWVLARIFRMPRDVGARNSTFLKKRKG